MAEKMRSGERQAQGQHARTQAEVAARWFPSLSMVDSELLWFGTEIFWDATPRGNGGQAVCGGL
jgi:hypothetical protein